MEIRNEYTSFDNRQYRNHTHHITKCLHEEEAAAKPAAGALAGAGTGQGRSAEFSRDGDIYHMSAFAAGQSGSAGKGKSLLKGFWDALGEEGEEAGKERNAMAAFRENLLSGIYSAAASIRHSFSSQVIERIKNLRERFRTGAKGGYRYSRGSREDFAALADGRAPSHKESKNRRSIRRQELLPGEAPSLRKQEDIPMKILVNSHLMDSYSKSGEYCQLGENLTYGKGMGRRKESAGKE